jgi:hypothetical protein
MMQRERARRWCLELFLVGVLGILSACGNPGGEGCGGIEDIVSCLSITSIQPTANEANTSDVDVVQNLDCNGDGVPNDPEPFTRHDANVTFANDAHPQASSSLDVTIRRVSVSYTLTNCPVGAVCPPLPGFTQEVSLVVPAGSATTGTFPLVPISTKQAFVSQGGSATAFPAYSAHYTFTAQTQFFSDTIEIEGNTGFVLGNFNFCE